MSTPIDQMNDIECLREIARRCGVSGTQGLNEIGSLRGILSKLSGSAQNETEALRFLTTGSTSSGGTVNTGNAAVGDVAVGKTFSSAVLTNATGTSTKNATVTGDVPVLPVQAWVDFQYAIFIAQTFSLAILNLAGTHAASISTDWLSTIRGNYSGWPDIYASGCVISNANSIISSMAQSGQLGGAGDQILDFTGSSVNTGSADYATLIGASWTILS